MAITKRPPVVQPQPGSDAQEQRFIQSAPDAAQAPQTIAGEGRRVKGVMKGNRAQITHTLPPELLARLDEVALQCGQTRAGLINMAISDYINKLSRGVN